VSGSVSGGDDGAVSGSVSGGDDGAVTGATAERRIAVPDTDATMRLGASLGRVLRAGDLLLLSGPLGAGKTTLVRGIGEGLGVRGPVTSPTFVLARVHPSLVGGPALVHVDAYRLGGLDELEDLGLEADLEASVLAVEWGSGLAEGLADARLEVDIARHDADDTRSVTLRGFGPGWAERLAASVGAPS
jgi:tRNA threonylcarbamoyladenosine biosynthesis protein TsaE